MTDSAAARVQRLVPEGIRGLSAYHVADSRGYVKLDAMENPYPWPEDLRDAWLARLRGEQPNRYPESSAPSLNRLLRQVMAIPDGLELVLGNGSDELIQLLMLAVAPGTPVLAPEPSFSMYAVCARVLGRPYVPVALDPQTFALRRAAMLEAIEAHRPGLVFIAYPNNPTGNLFERADVEAVIEASPGLVVIDEAYAPFAGVTMVDAALSRPNVVVVRTVSKLGLAGLRLGLLCGQTEWATELEKVRLPYNINILTRASAEFALEHHRVFDRQVARILEDREQLLGRLQAMNAVDVWPSAANFLLVRVPGRGAGLVDALKAEGVLVRRLHGSSPLLEDCIRVSVGTPEENEAFLAALAAVL
ncbi:MAG: histidinol-phosphate transaminase [Ectothiorhodospiraceae bacterium]|nr:histidinol-phosphate transaminase [Ectothiorhodospiraceae bacterium]